MRLIIIITVIFLTGCNGNNANRNNNSCLSIVLNDNFIPMIDQSVKYDLLLKPIEDFRDSCSFVEVAVYQGQRFYSCINYKALPGVQFRRIEDTTFISRIDFEKIEQEVFLGNQKLIRKMKVSDIDTNSCLNLGITKIGNSIEATLKGMNSIMVNDATRIFQKPYLDNYEFLFDSIGLRYLTYNFQPSYSEGEWERYLSNK